MFQLGGRYLAIFCAAVGSGTNLAFILLEVVIITTIINTGINIKLNNPGGKLINKIPVMRYD